MITEIFRGGLQDGLRLTAQPPLDVGDVREVFAVDDCSGLTHLYRGKFKGGKKIILRYVGLTDRKPPPQEPLFIPHLMG